MVSVPKVTADDHYRQGLTAFAEATPEGYLRAANSFREAYRMTPTRCEFPLHLAQALLFLAEEQQLNLEDHEPNRKEAITLVETIRMPCAASEPFLLRLDSLIQGRTIQTAAMMKRATELDPADPMNWHVYSKVEVVNRESIFQRAADLGRDSALHLYTFAAHQANRGALTQAIRTTFRRVMELSPRHFRAHLELAFALSADDVGDESAEVEPLYKKVVEIAPNFLEGRLAAGNYFAAIDETEAALEQYNAAVQSNPRFSPGYFATGLLLLRAERSKEAEDAFLKVIDLDPVAGEAFYYLGFLALSRDDLEVAKNRFQQAVDVRVNYAAAEYGLGRVFQRQNDPDAALSRFDRAIRFQSTYADAYFSRATIRAERRQTTEAISDLNRAVQLFDQQITIADATIAFGKSNPQSRAAQANAPQRARQAAAAEHPPKRLHV
jgi:Tfp pilus assembly protein PilF